MYMSRVGKKPVIIPSGVKAELKGETLTVTSVPKGALSMTLHPKVMATVTATEITIDVAGKDNKRERALWGLFRSLTQNLVEGVTKGFEKKLEVNGVGFKVATQPGKLVMSLGFSHPVAVLIPEEITVAVRKKCYRR